MVGSLQPDRQVQAAQNCIGYHYPYHAVAHPRNRYDTGAMLSPTQTIHINHGANHSIEFTNAKTGLFQSQGHEKITSAALLTLKVLFRTPLEVAIVDEEKSTLCRPVFLGILGIPLLKRSLSFSTMPVRIAGFLKPSTIEDWLNKIRI